MPGSQGKNHTLHIFNPEHDMALAIWDGPYTPPAEILNFKNQNSLLPALYAGNGDFILIPSEYSSEDISTLPYYEKVLKKNIRLVKKEDIHEIVPLIDSVTPWGWDRHVCAFLFDNGIPESLLPPLEYLQRLRLYSNRAWAIEVRKKICKILGVPVFNPAERLNNPVEVGYFLKAHPKAYFKAPWSSSGRGLIVSDHISRKGLDEWTLGVLRKQGSVIGEPKWDRVFDFATEWNIIDGEPLFVGYSVFHTSPRGKYHGNVMASQEELLKMIQENVPAFNIKMVDAQKAALKELIAPAYSGPLGIDMFVDSQGRINECVEINLRLTMGYIQAVQHDSVLQVKNSLPSPFASLKTSPVPLSSENPKL